MPQPVPHNRMQIKERRENILILLTKGMKGYEIAKELGVDPSTVSRDIQYLIGSITKLSKFFGQRNTSIYVSDINRRNKKCTQRMLEYLYY